jgi:hypothetical protein
MELTAINIIVHHYELICEIQERLYLIQYQSKYTTANDMAMDYNYCNINPNYKVAIVHSVVLLDYTRLIEMCY